MKAISDLLNDFITKNNINEKYHFSCVLDLYNEQIRFGNPLLKKTYAVKSVYQTLWIQTPNSCNSFELTMLKENIIREINKNLENPPLVKDLKFIQTTV